MSAAGDPGASVGRRCAAASVTAAVFVVCVGIVFAGGSLLRLLAGPTERGPAALGVRIGMTGAQAREALERAGLGAVRAAPGGALEADAPAALRERAGVWSARVELVRGRVAQVDVVVDEARDAAALLSGGAAGAAAGAAREEDGVAVVTVGPRLFLVDLRCDEHAARGRELLGVARAAAAADPDGARPRPRRGPAAPRPDEPRSDGATP